MVQDPLVTEQPAQLRETRCTLVEEQPALTWRVRSGSHTCNAAKIRHSKLVIVNYVSLIAMENRNV